MILKHTKINLKCSKFLYNFFGYFFPFFNGVIRNLFMAISKEYLCWLNNHHNCFWLIFYLCLISDYIIIIHFFSPDIYSNLHLIANNLYYYIFQNLNITLRGKNVVDSLAWRNSLVSVAMPWHCHGHTQPEILCDRNWPQAAGSGPTGAKLYHKLLIIQT